MNNGIIKISSDLVNETIFDLRNSCVNLENNLINKLPGNFSTLTDLGFFSNGINIIMLQSNKIVDLHNTLITQISQHLNEYAIIEDELTSTLESGLGDYSIKNNDYNGNLIMTDDIAVNEINKGLSINTSNLIKKINNLTDEEKANIINLLSIYKNNDVSVAQLLTNNNNSEQLYVILQNILGNNNSTLSANDIEEYNYVQKLFLEAISNSNAEIQELNTNSILIAKEYLNLIAKENDINLSSLLLDDKYKNVLQVSLLDLYDGNNIGKYNLDSEYVNKVRNYLTNVAEKNNIDIEDLLFNKIDLIL